MVYFSKMKLRLLPFLALSIFWTIGLFSLLYIEVRNVNNQAWNLSLYYAQAFFQSIVTTRSWNAIHGGVYVPVTENTQPNPYLEVPERDVTTTGGRKLTLINPAYMTRQIADIALRKNLIKFHITSLNPIRPENSPDPWETASLRMFDTEVKENAELIQSVDNQLTFRYMAPLWTKKECLKCHSKQGYEEGDLRGGISVSIESNSIIDLKNQQIIKLIGSHIVIWVIVLIGIYVAFALLRKESARREQVIDELKIALNNVKTLSGLVPICANCKKIRDDDGYWRQIESYIEQRSEAQFSHGICQDCAGELYKDTNWYKKIQK